MGRAVEVGVAVILRRGAPTDPKAGARPPLDHDILITLRRSDTPYEGFWELPGGKVEPGETPAQAVTREVREEIGCRVELVRPLDRVTHRYDHADVVLHPWVCRLAAESDPPKAIEVDGVRWVSLGSLPWERFLPANVRIVTALRRSEASEPLEV